MVGGMINCDCMRHVVFSMVLSLKFMINTVKIKRIKVNSDVFLEQANAFRTFF